MMLITIVLFDKLEGNISKQLSLFLEENMGVRFCYEGGECMIAVKDKREVVGFGYVSDGELKYLCVDKNYRSMGIGTRILTKLLDKHNNLKFKVPTYGEVHGNDVYYYSESLGFYIDKFNVTRSSEDTYEVTSRISV